MKTVGCLLMSVCISIASYGQSKLDSLKARLFDARNNNKKEEVSRLFDIAYYFYELHSYDSAIFYYNEMLKKAVNKDQRASALNNIGTSYSQRGMQAQSITYYNEAILLYEELKDTNSVISASNNLAIIYKNQGLYEDALEMAFNALPKLERLPPDRTLASIYNTIGTSYSHLQDYEKAYEYYRKALVTRIAINYQQGVAHSYNNIGELFNERKQYDSALKNLDRAVVIVTKLNDTRGLGRTLTNIGHSLTYSGKVAEAINKLHEAIQLARTSDDLVAEVFALHELGNAYSINKDFKKAEESLARAAQLIDNTKSRGYLKQNLELKAALYRASGDRYKLLNTLESLLVVKDSIMNDEKIKKSLLFEIRYETEKKEQKIILLQQQDKTNRAELEKNRLQKIVLFIAISFLVVTTILGFRLYFAKQREKKISDLYNKEMHHRTKNNLQMLSSLFTIQASIREGDKKAQELIIDMQGRVKTMALVHAKLYKSMDASELDLKEYISELASSLVYTYGFKGKLDLDIDAIQVEIDKAIKIGLIINELITNALKYAYAGQSNPSLKVSVSKNERSIVIEVSDNGKSPMPGDVFENGGSFGLRMIKLFAREMKGQLELRNSNGTSISISIPQS